MEIFCNYIWEQGFRDKNEDAIGIREVSKNGKSYFFAVVCDGIGGLTEGETASSYVVKSLLDTFLHFVKNQKICSGRRVRNTFYRRLYQCHKNLMRYGSEKNIRLGTTVSMIFLTGCHGYLIHIGDSSFFKGKYRLKRITKLQRTEAGALQQAIGIGNNPKPEWKHFILRRGTVLLLGSDGFYRKCEHEIITKEWIKKINYNTTQIKSLLNDKKLSVQKLGERDNISAICVKVR